MYGIQTGGVGAEPHGRAEGIHVVYNVDNSADEVVGSRGRHHEVNRLAFIVEMWWGRPHEVIVQDVDENGELYDREVIPDKSPDPERRAS